MSKERISVILDIDAEVSKAKGNIGSLTKIFDGIGGNKGNQLRNILSDINVEYQKLADESGRSMSKIGDFSKAEKSTEKLSQLFRKLEKEMGNIGKMSDSDLDDLFPPDVAEKIKKASDALKTFNTMMDNSTKSKGVIGKATKEYEDQEKAVKKAAQALKELQDVQNGISKKQVVTADVKVTKADDLKKAKAALDVYQKELEEANRKMEEFKATKAEMFANHNEGKSSAFRKLKQEVDAAEKSFKSAAREVDELNRELKNMVVVGDLDNDIQAAEKALEDAQEAAKKLRKNLDEVSADEFSKALGEAKKKLEELADVDLSEIGNIDDLNNLFKRFTNEGVEGLKKGLEEAGIEIKNLGQANKEAGDKVKESTEDVKRQNEALGQLDGIKSRITEFFKLDNAIQLARQGLQKTFETIKELDKAMAETAVVTDFSVGDMWDALPKYTKAANELGTTTLGAYETMTLFYQQGLDTNEVFEVGTETMKMARIAGLDYAEATNLMTAALRGFNMELNETSAQRVNDVYSELAAITAADTEEIATAMTKTASIAKSANMEFETTAAFLSQIIETTREPAETAGTAMKTIIARFTEMKKASSDVINFEGEEINVNKVEEALRSAGVALRDVNGEFRDTDDVFLELASKWDNLDIMTQRYIATMAAGSRQQSRFLAMMQDYDRTIELIDAAYNSSGASAAQFAKTQETLESKLNKLKNAWDEFLMGIADSKIVKGFVDVLTQILNVVNKLTGNSGLAKLATAIAAFKGGQAIFGKIFKNSKTGSLIETLIGSKQDADNAAKNTEKVTLKWWDYIKLIKNIGGTIKAIFPLIAALAAELAIIGAAWYFSDEQVETRKLKEAQELSEGLAKGLEDAKEAVATIADDRNGLETLKNDLKELVAGTDEWRLKLLEVQAEENRLINKYNLNDVSGAVRIDSQGNQVITSSGWDYLEKRQTEAVERQLSASQIADATVQRQQFEVEKIQRLEAAEDKGAGKVDETLGRLTGTAASAFLGKAGYNIGAKIGGEIAKKWVSAKIGAVIGAKIGTVVAPVIGTAIGVVAGIAVGKLVNEVVEEFGHDEDYEKEKSQLSHEERVAEQQKNAKYKSVFKTSMSGNEDFKKYSSEQIDALATVSAANLDKYIEEGQGFWKDAQYAVYGANKNEIKDWAENYKGYTYLNGTVYDAQGNEVDISDKKAIANELSLFKAMEKSEDAAKQAAVYLEKGGTFVEGLNENITKNDFAKILSGDAGTSYDLVEQMLQKEKVDEVAKELLKGESSDEDKIKLINSLTGYTEKEIEKGLKKYDGNYQDYLANILQEKATETAVNQKYMQRDFFEEALLSGYGRDNVLRQAVMGNYVDDISYNIDTAEFNSLTKMVEELDAATLQTVSTIGTNLRTAFQSSGVAGKIFFEALSGMDSSQVEEVASYLGDVDFSNPIKGAHAFQTALENVDDGSPIQRLIEDLQDVSKTQYDVGSQFDFLMNSGIYDSLQESIAGIIEENGKLTADNIIELSGASEELSLMLEQDENMAESLAKAFTIVETQGLDAMQGITTATLKALGETETLATMYTDMMASIENFKPAVDTMSGIDFIGQSLETMKGMIDSGEYGNAQLHSYLEHFFGEGSADSVDEIIKNYNKLTRWSKNEGRNFWTEASAADALIGDSTETETISTTFKTGNLSSIKIAKGLTTEQALEQLQNSMHITEDAARDYLAVLTSHSLELANTLKENDAGAAVETLVKTRQEQLGITEGGVVSEDEVKTIAVAYDMDEDTLKAWLEEDYGITIVGNFVDDNNNPLTGEALQTRLNQELGDKEISSVMVLDTAPAESGFDSVVDYVETKEVLMDLGMTEEQANETIDNFIEENNGKVGIAVNGEVIPETTAQAANDWANSMLSSIKISTLTTLVDKLAQVDFSPVAEAVGKALLNWDFVVEIAGKVTTFLDAIGTWLYGLMTGGKKPSVDVNNKTTDSNGDTKTTTTTRVISPTFNVNPIKSYVPRAKGSDGLPKDEEALTGEKGVELVQSKDGMAYLVGTNGPEIASLKKGDIVYPHDETKKILKGGPKKTFHGYASGTKSKVPTSLDMMVLAVKTVIAGAKITKAKKEKEKENKKNTPVLPVVVDDRYAGNVQKVIEHNAKKNKLPLPKSDPYPNSKIKNNNKQSTTTTTNNNRTTTTNNTNSTTTKKRATTTTNNKSNTETIANLEEQIKSLERKKKNGTLSESDFQTKVTPLLNQQHTLYGKEKQKAIDQSKGAIYYDKATDTIQYNTEKFNKLGDKDKETVRKLYDQAVQFNQHQNDIEDQITSFQKQNDENDKKKQENDKKKQENAVEAGLQNNQEKLDNLDKKKESGELSYQEWRDAREPLLTNRQTLLDAEYKNKLADTNGVIYEDKDGNLQYNMTKFNKLDPDKQDDMEATFKKLSSIDKEKKDIATEVASYNKKGSTTDDGKTTNTFNEKRELEELEEKYAKGEIAGEEYETQKKDILTRQYSKEISAFENAYNGSEYKKYFTYDKDTGEFKLNETTYNGADAEIQKKIDEEGDRLSGLYDTADKTKEELEKLKPNENFESNFNIQAKMNALDRQYKQGKKGGMDYSKEHKEAQKEYKNNLQSQLDEGLKGKYDAYFDYDSELDTLVLNEKELVKLSEEEQQKVLQEVEALQKVNDEINDMEDAARETAKYLKYSTTNTDALQQALNEDLANGDMDPAEYQTQMKQANKAENRSLKGENNDIMKSIQDDVGPVFFNTQTRRFEWNELFDQSKLSKKEQEAIQGWMDEKNGELEKAIKNKDSATIAKIKKEYQNSGYGSLYYTDPTTGTLLYDEYIFDKQEQSVKDEAEDNVKTHAANTSQIKGNNEENEDLTARKEAWIYDSQQYDYELEDIERQYQNGTLSHSQYEAKKKTALENKKTALLKEFAYQTNAETSDYANLLKYVDVKTDENGNVSISGSKEKGYYGLTGVAKDEVDAFIELLRGIYGETCDIDATLKDPMFTDSSVAEGGKTAATKRDEYDAASAALWNLAGDQENLAEDREDLSNLQGIVGKLPLPQEMQTALGMGFTAANMGYEAQEIMQTRSNYNLLNDQRELRETESEYVGPAEQALSDDPLYAKVAAYWDSTDNVYKINEKKFNENLTEEERAKLLEDVKTFRDEFGNELNQLARAMDGGIIQDAAELLGKSLKDVSKAFDKGEDEIYDTKEALRALEATLGLTEGSLAGFEDTLAKIAQGAEKATFKRMGMTSEQLKPLTSFLQDNQLGGVADLFSLVLGGGDAGDTSSFNGAQLLGSATGAMGELFEVGSGFMNWEMIGGGVELFTQGISLGQQIYDRIKQGIEKIKQVIEQVIQYISQATQVLIDAWTNREDYLYNYLKLIEKHLQEYEKLQRYSTQIQKGRIASADDIAKNWEDQWASLQQQLEEQTERLETRQQELDRSRWNPFMLISGWDPLSDTLYENREVKMLWDIIIGLGEAFAPLGTGTFFSQLNQLYEDYDQRVQQSYEDRLAAEQALLDIEDERLELVKVGADEATQFEDKVLQALIQKEQEAIDELSRLNDAVTTANQKLMSTLQDNLSKIRQDRENEKKEEELGEKERRLAYLRQDTSGANTVEIKRLEKELDEQHEDYTDTLIDQKISELEKQNELAAEQRQQQIDLLQGQLDYAEKYGLYWETIYDMLYSIDENGKVVINADNFDVDGNIRENSQLAQLLGTHSDRMGMSTWQSVLDNEETKLLGLYYKAFMTRNGADGNWADYWALLDPGANDPDYTRQMAEIPGGLRGVLSRLEIGIREYFGTSNFGLANMGRSAEQGFKNFFGKLFNYEPWENFKAESFNKSYVEADTMNAIHKTEVAVVNGIKDGFNNFFGLNQKAAQTGRQTTERANSNSGSEKNRALSQIFNITLDIEKFGESIGIDEVTDKVVSSIKGLFQGNINAYTKSQ